MPHPSLQVLYGANIIVVDDLLDTRDWQTMSPVVQLQRQRQIGQVGLPACVAVPPQPPPARHSCPCAHMFVPQVFALYNQMRELMSDYAMRFLANHSGVQYWVSRWKARIRVCVLHV
jgi:hypothetical protein